MLSLVAVLLLAEPVVPPHVFVQDLTGLDMTASELQFFTGHLAQALGDRGFQVVTSAQVSTVLGLERQRQLLGCAEGSCVVELAQAMGVDAVVAGSIGRLDGRYSLSVRAFSASQGTLLRSYSETVDDRTRVLEAMGRAAAKLSGSEALPASAPSSLGPNVTLIAGSVALAIGAGCFIAAHVVSANLDVTARTAITNPISMLEKSAKVGEALQTTSFVAFIVGGVGVATGLVWKLLAGSGAPAVSLAVDGHTASLVIGGALP